MEREGGVVTEAGEQDCVEWNAGVVSGREGVA